MKFQLSETIWWWIEPCGEAPLLDCADGWTFFEGTGKCYRYIVAKLNWPQARDTCNNYAPANGELASVPNSATNDFLRKLTAVPGADYIWLGGYRSVDLGVWYWTDGTPWGYDAWSAGQPSPGLNVTWKLDSVCLSQSNGSLSHIGSNYGLVTEVKYLQWLTSLPYFGVKLSQVVHTGEFPMGVGHM